MKYLFFTCISFLLMACVSNSPNNETNSLDRFRQTDSTVFCALLCGERSYQNKDSNCCKRQIELYHLDSYIENMNEDSTYKVHIVFYEKHGHVGGAVTYAGSGNFIRLNTNRQIEVVEEKFTFYSNHEGLKLSRELIDKLSTDENISEDLCNKLKPYEFLFNDLTICD